MEYVFPCMTDKLNRINILDNREMKQLQIIVLIFSIMFIPSCSSVTNSYEQDYSFTGDEAQLIGQELNDGYALPYPKDACIRASAFFMSNFKKSDLAVDGQFRVSLLNDSVWIVMCPVRYGLNPKAQSWSGFDNHSTLLISRKDGEILYFTIGLKNKPPRTSKNDYLQWTDLPVAKIPISQ